MTEEKREERKNQPHPQDSAPTDPEAPPSAEEEEEADELESQPQPSGPPVVGIGASAGGLKALEAFFRAMPSDSGLAFVVVQHLAANYKSALPDLLQKYTKMKVVPIADGMKVKSNQIYIIPPNQELGLMNGVLHLLEMLPRPQAHLTIDRFFRYLADDKKSKAICVILSGSGSDGTLGLRQIKEQGGLVIVQDPKTAAYSGMPNSAVQTGLADYVLSPAKMAQVITTYRQRRYMIDGGSQIDDAAKDGMNKVFLLLRAETGLDFSQYRLKSLHRRISKRMAIHGIDRIEHYIQYLRQRPEELTALFHEILIGVTQFFREPEAYEAFQKKVLPTLFERKSEEEPLRVWVVGCSTGEEAYTLAMLIHDYRQDHQPGRRIAMFATDATKLAIERARLGEYPATIATDVPEKFLNRYFSKSTDHYQIKPEIREMLVFAQQNLLADPPFSRLDLISCRNVLIYLKPKTQRELTYLFQFALKPNGFLFLGSAESIGDDGHRYFSPVDRRWRLFRRTEERRLPPSPSNLKFGQGNPLEPISAAAHREKITPTIESSRRELVEKSLLDHLGVVGILVDENYEVIYSYGQVDTYLKVASGAVRFNILEMARPGLQGEVITAIRFVLSQNKVMHRQAVRVATNGYEKVVDLTVRPVSETDQKPKLVMVIIQEVSEAKISAGGPFESKEGVADEENPRVAQLRAELENTRDYLHGTIKELQTTNEEHRSFIEEIQSASEELQSTNEELTTSQEELQSVNEELITANAEIQSKNESLRRTNNDLHNLLTGTEIATIFLDVELNIRRFTPAATKIINLITSDVGRPLKHVVSNLKYTNLVADAERVLRTLDTVEQEVETEDGRWYNMRILPYRTVHNVIDGLVLTFADVSAQKEIERELRRLNDQLQDARDYAENIVATVHEALLILDHDLRIESANRSFYEKFSLPESETQGKLIYELDRGKWDVPELRRLLERVVTTSKSFDKLDLEQEFSEVGQKRLQLNARRLIQKHAKTIKVLLAIEEV